MRFLYTLSVRLYVLAIKVASLWNTKARSWVNGRRDVWTSLENFKRDDSPVYWFHCASLGEFEQGRPLMERLKNEEECQLVITFFSPSGYEIRKNYALADLIVYLPVDSTRNARRLLDCVEPTKVFFIKYEFWANYIFELKKREIPFYLVSAVFRKGQIFFKWYGSFMRKVLNAFDQIFVQNESSQKLLTTIEVNSILSGDTRYDRVMENAKKVQAYPDIDQFVADRKVLIAGSIWQEDAEVLFPLVNQLDDRWKVIIAPHEINENTIQTFETQLKPSTCRYSAFETNKEILIIDNIGMLMNLYQYGDIAYIGGAFKTGLHNILEPAAFGLPVIFGPEITKFPEATQFIQAGIGFSIRSNEELKKCFNQLQNEDLSAKIEEFMQKQSGATEVVASNL